MTQDDFYDTAAKTYVRYVLDETGLAPSALAKGAGLSSTTLTRALNNPGHKFTLSMTTLGKIREFTGINFNPFFEAKDFAEMSMAPYERPDIVDDRWIKGSKPYDPEPTRGHMTIVIGHTAAGVWKVPELLQLEKHAPLWISMPNTNATDVFALMVDDNSAAPNIEQGEYAMCLRMRATKSPLAHGDLLVVERWRDNSSLMEITIRRLIVPGEKPAFLRFDNVEAFPEALEYQGDTKELRVLGKVEWAIRDPRDYRLRSEYLGRKRFQRPPE